MTAFRRSRNTALLVAVSTLFALSAAAAPRDVRMQSPNGDGGTCPDAVAEAESPAPQAPKRAATREKAKATPMMRSGGDASAKPRWHSFLPGMFR